MIEFPNVTVTPKDEKDAEKAKLLQEFLNSDAIKAQMQEELEERMKNLFAYGNTHPETVKVKRSNMKPQETLAAIDHALTHPDSRMDALKQSRGTINDLLLEVRDENIAYDRLCKEIDELSSDEDCPAWMKAKLREVLNG